MGTAPVEDLSEIRASLLDLMKGCPLFPNRPKDCPLASLREMEAGARWKWIEGLTKDDLMFIAAYHHVCLKEKMERAAKRRKRTKKK